MLCSIVILSAQDFNRQNYKDTSLVYLIEIKDGTKLMAKVLDMDSAVLTLRTPLFDQIKLPLKNVNSIRPANLSATQLKNFNEHKSDSKTTFLALENPHPTRYFFSPSAYQLKKGERYYQNAYLFVNSWNYGISEHFSMGFGLEVLTTIRSLTDGFDVLPSFFITPKWGYKISDNLNLGFGALAGIMPELFEEENQLFGVAYGLATYGNMDNNITLGLGEGKFISSADGRPLVTLSAMLRMGKKMTFVTENWFMPYEKEEYHYSTYMTYYTYTKKYETLFSYGLRYFERNFSFDFGFINNQDITQFLFIGIPYVDVVIKF